MLIVLCFLLCSAVATPKSPLFLCSKDKENLLFLRMANDFYIFGDFFQKVAIVSSNIRLVLTVIKRRDKKFRFFFLVAYLFWVYNLEAQKPFKTRQLAFLRRTPGMAAYKLLL